MGRTAGSCGRQRFGAEVQAEQLCERVGYAEKPLRYASFLQADQGLGLGRDRDSLGQADGRDGSFGRADDPRSGHPDAPRGRLGVPCQHSRRRESGVSGQVGRRARHAEGDLVRQLDALPACRAGHYRRRDDCARERLAFRQVELRPHRYGQLSCALSARPVAQGRRVVVRHGQRRRDPAGSRLGRRRRMDERNGLFQGPVGIAGGSPPQQGFRTGHGDQP